MRPKFLQQSTREIELRDAIADLRSRVMCGRPLHLQDHLDELTAELNRLIAARLSAAGTMNMEQTGDVV